MSECAECLRIFRSEKIERSEYDRNSDFDSGERGKGSRDHS
jgi:hypothetical protein